MRLFNYDIDENALPGHVGIIMDGNGRWALKKGLPRVRGHAKGYQVLRKIIEFNKKIGIKYISVYAFSTENWRRPPEEVNFLMQLAKNIIGEYTETLLKNDIRLLITGVKDNLDGELSALLDESVAKTSRCSSYVLDMVFNYGGRREIIDAAKKMAADYKNGTVSHLEDLDEKAFGNYLYVPELPDVDLIIRTSGEYRLSNFLIWQSSYSEMFFTKRLWPDFRESDFCRAVSSYQARKRRFGDI